MTEVWDEVFYNVLRVSPQSHPVFLTETALNPKESREQMTEIMFEGFRTPAMYVAIQAQMALYCTGRTTGIVLDVGDGVSHSIPIYEGYSLPHAVLRKNIAGRDLTSYLTMLMRQRGFNFVTGGELEIVRQIKEEHCYVALDKPYEDELPELPIERRYELPDGQIVTIGRERYECPECLFNPSLIGAESEGIHKLIYDSVSKCDIDLRAEFYKNIVLSGGTSMLPGMGYRVKRELCSLLPATVTVNITEWEKRQYMVWRGASILASLSSFACQWISSQEYDEHGPRIVHRKCL
ncbi:actin-3, muscle-specific-like [Bolinopsis microptera]|uniref:actin-3, muscle-specific-like n=1 Tax=Bolinopsis microptera TaxID=2820187 RepID=UPI00307ACEFC